MTTVMADRVASFAASILVAMPPVPRLVPRRRPCFDLGVDRLTTGISLALDLCGDRLCTALNVAKQDKQVRIHEVATIAERLSLSPNFSSLISSVASTSFSLMIGTTRNDKSDRIVLRAFK